MAMPTGSGLSPRPGRLHTRHVDDDVLGSGVSLSPRSRCGETTHQPASKTETRDRLSRSRPPPVALDDFKADFPVNFKSCTRYLLSPKGKLLQNVAWLPNQQYRRLRNRAGYTSHVRSNYFSGKLVEDMEALTLDKSEAIVQVGEAMQGQMAAATAKVMNADETQQIQGQQREVKDVAPQDADKTPQSMPSGSTTDEPDAQTARYHEILMSSGHQRAEIDKCDICFCYIEFRVSKHSKVNVCCMKKWCNGCVWAAIQRGMCDKCPFCRTPLPSDDASKFAMLQKRVDKGDADAISYLGKQYYLAGLGLTKDITRAIELWTEAAELGSAEAHFILGDKYYCGSAATPPRPTYAEALIGYQAAFEEMKSPWREEHWMISAKMGFEDSLTLIKEMLKKGHAAKVHQADFWDS
ncbi:hypothetical protein THAOC_18655, partial [Thalassiosira oceanica]